MDFARNNYTPRRIILTVIGVLICGIDVGFIKFAAFGVDPFTSTVTALDNILPISYGLLYIIINALLLLFSLIFDKHYIGLGTFINLFLLGYVVQFTHQTLSGIFPDASLLTRVIFLITGLLLHCFSAAMYMTADLGVSTYDAVALIIVNTWHKGKFKYMRMITDLACVLLAAALHILSGAPVKTLPAIVGAGTIIIALFMGPLVDIMASKIIKPYLLKES